MPLARSSTSILISTSIANSVPLPIVHERAREAQFPAPPMPLPCMTREVHYIDRKRETDFDMTAMDQDGRIFVGKSEKPEYLAPRMANRHGLVTGATGTGKTVTLQVLAEGFSTLGVPVFAAD